MKTFSKIPPLLAACSVVLATLGAAPAAHTLLYRSDVTTTQGQQQSVAAVVTIEPQVGGTMQITVAATGAPVVTVAMPAGGAMPAPQGTPSPQRAQGMVILQRIALLGQIRRAMPASSIGVRIPVLAPGASKPLALAAELTLSSVAAALTASASASTMATIDPTKAKIKGILPARRIAERVKNALTPSHVTLPDKITATVRAPVVSGSVTKLSGQVIHVLTAHGQTTTATENWSLKPSS